MQRTRCFPRSVLLGLIGLGLAACAPPAEEHHGAETVAGKVPLTSASEEAIELYLEARDLGEKLKAADAHEVYRQAVGKDGGFAMAHLGLANTSATAQEFFDAVGAAVAASEGASDGERWTILAAQAGANGDPAAQKDYLTKLIDAYPDDERAHFLLANWHNGRQEYEPAIEHYNHAIEIAPEYSSPYNSLGYAQRAVGDNAAAEEAFKKYVELLPEEPNPYDSYAELLMKMGRFEESIENYEKALSKDATFVASFVGIGNNQVFMGQPAAARASFEKLQGVARNDGQRRQAMFWTAVSHLHEGDYDEALEALEKRYEIAAETDDKATLAGDLTLMGNVLLHHGDPEAAAAKFDQALEMIEMADVSDDVKQGTRRNYLYDMARQAIHRDDLDDAAARLDEYNQAVAAKQIPFEVRRTHEVAGMLALHRGDAATARAELAQANQQDPRVLYLQALACQRDGDEAGMKSFAAKTANFNQLNLNLAFVKAKAEHLAEGGA